jgi:hypothetical protein
MGRARRNLASKQWGIEILSDLRAGIHDDSKDTRPWQIFARLGEERRSPRCRR